jgi:homoserine trans-succinylase
LKEYLRDIKRYLRKERKCYPSVPRGYFDTKTTELLAHFQEAAQDDTRETLIESFPEAQVAHTLENTWQKCATRVYANWLQYLLHRKEQTGRRAFARNA